MKLVLCVVVSFVLAGCVSPYDKFVHPTPTSSLYDWKCVTSDRGAFWTNDAGIHTIVGVVTDPTIDCRWITAAENCAGAPADQYQACLESGR